MCSSSEDGLAVDYEDGSLWVPLVVPVPPLLRVSDVAPAWLRKILLAVPFSWRPDVDIIHTCVAHFSASGELLRTLHDPTKKFGFLSSAEKCKQYLYLGSLKGAYAVQLDTGLL